MGMCTFPPTLHLKRNLPYKPHLLGEKETDMGRKAGGSTKEGVGSSHLPELGLSLSLIAIYNCLKSLNSLKNMKISCF